jgi:hypothetical protein
VKLSGVLLSALLGKVENAPAANAANPNLIIVFICMMMFGERVLRPRHMKETFVAAEPQRQTHFWLGETANASSLEV